MSYFLLYIHDIMNIARRVLADAEQRFINEIASLLSPWGLPITAGRVYGYLLLSNEPVSLDRIAADLEMSKGGAWNAARMLERFGNARRYGQPGSKRVLYGPSDDFAGSLAAQSALLGAIGKLLENCAATIASGEAVGRLSAMAEFYLAMRGTMDAAIQQMRAERASKSGRRSAPVKSAGRAALPKRVPSRCPAQHDPLNIGTFFPGGICRNRGLIHEYSGLGFCTPAAAGRVCSNCRNRSVGR